jgi:hypothetical protein
LRRENYFRIFQMISVCFALELVQVMELSKIGAVVGKPKDSRDTADYSLINITVMSS